MVPFGGYSELNIYHYFTTKTINYSERRPKCITKTSMTIAMLMYEGIQIIQLQTHLRIHDHV